MDANIWINVQMEKVSKNKHKLKTVIAAFEKKKKKIENLTKFNNFKILSLFVFLPKRHSKPNFRFLTIYFASIEFFSSEFLRQL
jgi:hypothetical protein